MLLKLNWPSLETARERMEQITRDQKVRRCLCVGGCGEPDCPGEMRMAAKLAAERETSQPNGL